MDNNTVIECATEVIAQQMQDEIHDARCVVMSADGYPVIDGEIVGKNALTGLPDYSACKTSCWDTPKDTGKETFYITDMPDTVSINITAVEGSDFQIVPFNPEWPIADQISTTNRFDKGIY